MILIRIRDLMGPHGLTRPPRPGPNPLPPAPKAQTPPLRPPPPASLSYRRARQDVPEEDVHGSSPSSLAASLPARNFTFWDPSQAGPSQDLFLARIIPENQGVNHTPLRTRSRAHGALRANSLPPGCCGQCSSGQLRAAQGSSGQLRAAQLDVRVRRLGLGPPCELRRRHRRVVARWRRPNGVALAPRPC